MFHPSQLQAAGAFDGYGEECDGKDVCIGPIIKVLICGLWLLFVHEKIMINGNDHYLNEIFISMQFLTPCLESFARCS